MNIIKLNFRRLTGTSVGSGHRSSNGWVSSWTDYTIYKLTVNTNSTKLSILECNEITSFKFKFQDKYEKDQDWGVYIHDEETVELLDITELITKLNSIQSKRVYTADNEAQEFSIDELLSFSNIEINEISKVIGEINTQETLEMQSIKGKYSIKRLQDIYPIFIKLLDAEQIQLDCKFLSTDKFPIDIVIFNNDTDRLIRLICKYGEGLKCANINELYASVVCSSLTFYENIVLNNNGDETSPDNLLFHYIDALEETFGKRIRKINNWGCEQNYQPLNEGMLALMTYLLSNGKFDLFERIVNNRKAYNKFNFGCYKSISIERFAYLAYGKLDKLNLTISNYEGSDYRFFSSYLYGRGSLFKELLPFYKLILNNDELIVKLAKLYGYHNDVRSAKEYLIDSLQNCIECIANLKPFINAGWC